jgi:hypothetical protein
MTKSNLKSIKQKGKKKYEYYAQMAHDRNHELINVSNPCTPSQGKLTVFCKNCEKEFTTIFNYIFYLTCQLLLHLP